MVRLYYNIVKVLVFIILNGVFNFVFKVWGGRIFDVNVIREFLFYDMCELYDEVMIDRGFIIIEDLILRYCKLYIFFGRCGKE